MTKGKKIEEQKIEIQQLKNELKIENERRLVLEQVLDLLPNTGTFIIEDIQKGIIGYSNKPGRDLVQKATQVQIKDGQTSIHQFHKKPEQSKGVLLKMNNGENYSNAILSIGKTVIKSSSHKFNINGKDYFLGLFEDGTIEKNEIETINFLKNNLETLLKIFLTYSTLGVNFKILLKDLEDARNGVGEQKELINGTLGKILEQFEKSNGLFNQITIANQDVATIFKSLSLLALNGQIEAARQGDQGRGFAVVAEETMKTSNLSENVMRDSIRIVKTGIEKTNQEIEGITENIKEIVENRTIEELVEKRVGESKHHLENLVKGIGELITIGGTLSSNFKNFYNEKLKGKEKARLILETTKIDHLLFIIKLNTALTMDNQKLTFPAHTSCDLGKTIYSKEFVSNFGEDEDYKMLLICHENVHKITNELNETIGKEKIISKNTLEACNIRIQDELMSQVNMVLHLIDNISKKLL